MLKYLWFKEIGTKIQKNLSKGTTSFFIIRNVYYSLLFSNSFSSEPISGIMALAS